MTTNSIASSYMQSLYAGSGLTTASPAASGFALPTTTSAAPAPTAAPTPKPAASASPVDNSSDAAFQAALAKLQQTDPSLSQKLQSFASQVATPDPAAAPTPAVASSGLQPAANHVEKHPSQTHAHHKGPHLDPAGPTSTAVPPTSTPVPTATAVPSNPPTFVGYKMMQGQSLSSFVQAQSPDLADSLFALAA